MATKQSEPEKPMMNKKTLSAAAIITLLVGGGVFYLTSEEYENAYYCYDSNVVMIGELQQPKVLATNLSNEICLTGWQSLLALCGPVTKGEPVKFRITQYVCDVESCKATKCEVTP